MARDMRTCGSSRRLLLIRGIRCTSSCHSLRPQALVDVDKQPRRLDVALLAASLFFAGCWCVRLMRLAPPVGISMPTRPIPISGPTRGARSARAALIMYLDFQCPYCRRFANATWPVIIERYVDPGRLLVVARYLPLPIHKHALQLANAADCAYEQRAFWRIYNVLFGLTHAGGAATATTAAVASRLDLDRFVACDVAAVRPRVASDIAEAHALGISSTPAFLLGRIGSDGEVHVLDTIDGERPTSVFIDALDRLVSAQGLR